jgi:Ca2+-transporting ATPase
MLKVLPDKPFTQGTDAVIEAMQVTSVQGLSREEVKQRREEFGENRLERQTKKNILFIFLEQFLSPVIYVLIGAAAIGFVFGETVEAIAVLVVILITVLIGFFMEWQAVRSMEALRKMAETHATVLRDGKEETIEAHEIVPGDILLLKSGQVVPADARLLEHQNLGVKEAALTGESTQVEKTVGELKEDTALADRSNMVFSGTLVTRGTARVLVTGTGENTELGKISQLTREATDEATPIEKRLDGLSKRLIWLTLIMAALVALSGYLQGRELKQMIETAIALAVAAIPEGLPIVATIALARGMLRLAKDRVIIKKLRAVETLGSTGVICTDKTGTLTENQMAARSLLFKEKEIEIPEDEQEEAFAAIKEQEAFIRLIETGVLCNNVQLAGDDEEKEKVGDPVEVALVELARAAGFDVKEIRKEHPEEIELPFDTETKMMATLNRFGDGYRVSAKGALESILDNCKQIYTEGEVSSFDDKAHWEKAADRMAAQGLRTLAFAYRDMDEPPSDKADLLRELTFLGLIGFIDPPRRDIKGAIATCKNAGIDLVMVTGDHPQTARYIAEAVGLLEKDASEEKILTGKELDRLAPESKEFEESLLKAAVLARVTPAQKLDLIRVYQKHNHVVGMTGDGVNDAPALKKADIGIAMGVRGTEAAKEVADVILRDDQFTSIELAIRQGRIIFENIRKFVVYLLSSNLAEIISVAVASFSTLPLPLLPLQILYLNLVTDVFPALALGLGEGERDIMEDPPRPIDEPIMPRMLWISTVVYGLAITVGVLGIVLFAHFYLDLEAEKVNNMAFYTLVLGQLLNVFNLPKRNLSFFRNEVTRNAWVWGAILLCILLTALGYIIAPLRSVLSLVPLSWAELGWVCAFALVSLILAQLVKRLGGTV